MNDIELDKILEEIEAIQGKPAVITRGAIDPYECRVNVKGNTVRAQGLTPLAAAQNALAHLRGASQSQHANFGDK